MSELSALLSRITKALDEANVPFMIAGSFASTAHGLPRATQDVDIVIDPEDLSSFDSFLSALSPEFLRRNE